MQKPARIAKDTPIRIACESGGGRESGILLKIGTGSVVWEWEHIITIGLATLTL